MYHYAGNNPIRYTDPDGESVMDWVHTGLDIVGFVPVVGDIADGVNAVVYLFEGDYGNAALSAASMIPVVGDAVSKGGKAVKAVIKHSDDIVGAGKQVLKHADDGLSKVVSNESKTLYHYTNEKGMNGIVESKQLNPSLKANNPKDARYGNGQYLSDIKPNSVTPSQLGKKFLNVPNKYKYTNYVEVDVSGLNVIKGREGVFVIPNETPLDLTNRIISTGSVGN